MKGFQRLISGIMAVCLMLSLIPVQAWAEEPVTETAAAETTEAFTVPTEGTSAPAETEAMEEITPATEETIPEGTVISASQEAVNSVVDSGTCGENLTWTLENGVLNISGTGQMYDYWVHPQDYSAAPPWYDYLREIESVIIGNSVTTIGDYAIFSSYPISGYCASISSITIGNSVTTIGCSAFEYCSYGENKRLTSVTIPASVIRIEDYAFAYCYLDSIYFEGDAPEMDSSVFFNSSATAYYPENNASWTKDVMQDYEGTITWVPYTPGEDTPDSGNTLTFHNTLNSLTELDYLAFAQIAYEDWREGQSVAQGMSDKWNKVWGEDGITYEELCLPISQWRVGYIPEKHSEGFLR